jgi:hypothetical protein
MPGVPGLLLASGENKGDAEVQSVHSTTFNDPGQSQHGMLRYRAMLHGCRLLCRIAKRWKHKSGCGY